MSKHRIAKIICSGLLSVSMTWSLIPSQAIYAFAAEETTNAATDTAATPLGPEGSQVEDLSKQGSDVVPSDSESVETATSEIKEDVALGTQDVLAAEPKTPAAPKRAARSVDTNEPNDASAASAVPTREKMKFSAGDYISELVFTVNSEGISKTYVASSGDTIDLSADFPQGISRNATYSARLEIDIRGLASSQSSYPLTYGDEFETTIPTMLKKNDTFSGSLRDLNSQWDANTGQVGSYNIMDGKINFKLVDGYIREQEGKVISSSASFRGSFDFSGYSPDAFTEPLLFGSIKINAPFAKDTSPRKLVLTMEEGSTFKDKLRYRYRLRADKSNTTELTNVTVSHLFPEEYKSYIDTSTLDRTIDATNSQGSWVYGKPVKDESGAVIGWNFGSLAPGEELTIPAYFNLNKDVVGQKIASIKEADPKSDAVEARTIPTTVTATADWAEPVQGSSSVTFNNRVNVSMFNMGSQYDSATQTLAFKFRLEAQQNDNFDSPNFYTMYNVPVHVKFNVDDPNRVGAIATSGIRNLSIKDIEYVDGYTNYVTHDVELKEIQQISPTEFVAVIPKLAAGSYGTGEAYVTFSDDFYDMGSNSYDDSSRIDVEMELGTAPDPSQYFANDVKPSSASNSAVVARDYVDGKGTFDESTGLITWEADINKSGVTNELRNIGGKRLVVELGNSSVFEDGDVTLQIFDKDGNKVGTDTVHVNAGDTRFEYVVPQQYANNRFVMTFTSKATDWETYIGDTKSYDVHVNGLGGKGLVAWRTSPVVLNLKTVSSDENWLYWETEVYRPLTTSDKVWYSSYTVEPEGPFGLTIAGIPVDPSLYEVIDGQIIFKGDVSVQKGTETLKPSRETPLVISFKSPVGEVKPQASYSVDNTAHLKKANSETTSANFYLQYSHHPTFRLRGSAWKDNVDWTYSFLLGRFAAQEDGTFEFTQVLPKGLKYTSVSIDNAEDAKGKTVELQSEKVNADGTTTLTFKVTGTTPYAVHNAPNSEMPLDITVRTKNIDPDYLYPSESKTFTYESTATQVSRYGLTWTQKATASVYRSSMMKAMEYNEATASNANFTIRMNSEGLDMNPDGDTLRVVDIAGDTLTIDPTSIEVYAGYSPQDAKIDTSGLTNNKLIIEVPDKQEIIIKYRAHLNGHIGEKVDVDNVAYLENHESYRAEIHKHDEITVIRGGGTAAGEPSVWLYKLSESGAALAGAEFTLDQYVPGKGWQQVRSGIQSVGGSSPQGIKLPQLSRGVLFRVTETKAPDDYIKDDKPYYFEVLDGSGETAELPADVADKDVLRGSNNLRLFIYNAPYTDVSVYKQNEAGEALEGAVFEVYEASTNKLATDKQGNEARMSSGGDGLASVSLAPGTYRLHEVTAPWGYQAADKDIEFVVTGDGNKTVKVNDAAVERIEVTNSVLRTSLDVTAEWKDVSDVDKARPASVQVQLFRNGEAQDGQIVTLSVAGADAQPGTADDWKASFTDLPFMENGVQYEYSVQELDTPEGYSVSYHTTQATATSPATAVLTHTRNFAPVSLAAHVTWDDNNNAMQARPTALRVRVLANGKDTGKTLSLTAAGPDFMLGSADDWSAVVSGLDRVANDAFVTYSVEQILPADYRQVGDVQSVDPASFGAAGAELGFELTNRYEKWPRHTESPSKKTKPSPKAVPQTSAAGATPKTGDAARSQGAAGLALAGVLFMSAAWLRRKRLG